MTGLTSRDGTLADEVGPRMAVALETEGMEPRLNTGLQIGPFAFVAADAFFKPFPRSCDGTSGTPGCVCGVQNPGAGDARAPSVVRAARRDGAQQGCGKSGELGQFPFQSDEARHDGTPASRMSATVSSV